MSDPGSKESAYRALHGHREHKTQTGGERQFGFYSRLISNLVPAPNVNHSGSSPLCCCTKTQFPKEKNSGSAAEASLSLPAGVEADRECFHR